MAQIDFHNQDHSFQISKPGKTRAWIQEVISRENCTLKHLNYIFCSDEYLLDLNKQYLNHKTLTDVITFDSSEEPTVVEGDIFISIERVQSNAKELSQTEDEELHRVIIHGVLHLLGYSDKTKSGQILMRKKEDAYLSLRSKL